MTTRWTEHGKPLWTDDERKVFCLIYGFGGFVLGAMLALALTFVGAVLL